MKIKITFFICFFAIIPLNAQEEQQFVEITGPVYKPKRMIKKIIDDLSKEPKCFETDNSITPRYHHLNFSFHKDTGDYYLIAISSSHFISRGYYTTIDSLPFSGIFYYKEYIVLLDFNHDKAENRNKFFKKTNKKLKIKVPVTKPFKNSCYSAFEIKGCDFILKDKSKSWEPIIINH